MHHVTYANLLLSLFHSVGAALSGGGEFVLQSRSDIREPAALQQRRHPCATPSSAGCQDDG